MNQLSLNNAILSFAFCGVLAPHRPAVQPSPNAEAPRPEEPIAHPAPWAEFETK